MKRDSDLWLRLMLLAFVANGAGPFGLKVLSESGLAQAYQSQYLVYWYLGGFIFALMALVGRYARVYGREVWIGALMGACSLSGQAFTGMALAHDVPGHIVFPLTTGGSLFLVVLAGILLFKERVGPYGIAGIALGIVALVALSIG
jgi:drug/metabolite transporter (DMT)-like permease